MMGEATPVKIKNIYYFYFCLTGSFCVYFPSGPTKDWRDFLSVGKYKNIIKERRIENEK